MVENEDNKHFCLNHFILAAKLSKLALQMYQTDGKA